MWECIQKVFDNFFGNNESKLIEENERLRKERDEAKADAEWYRVKLGKAELSRDRCLLLQSKPKKKNTVKELSEAEQAFCELKPLKTT